VGIVAHYDLMIPFGASWVFVLSSSTLVSVLNCSLPVRSAPAMFAPPISQKMARAQRAPAPAASCVQEKEEGGNTLFVHSERQRAEQSNRADWAGEQTGGCANMARRAEVAPP
jgi:hypothetical protein